MATKIRFVCAVKIKEIILANDEGGNESRKQKRKDLFHVSCFVAVDGINSEAKQEKKRPRILRRRKGFFKSVELRSATKA